MILIDLSILAILLIVLFPVLKEWILPPFYSWLNTKLNYDIYSGNQLVYPMENLQQKDTC